MKRRPWKKKGQIFCPDNDGWMASHATLPTVLLLDDRFRVYFAARNDKGQSSIGYVDVDRADPARVIGTSEKPVLTPGKLGMFDDSGVQPNCVLRFDGKVYLYYLGWNPSVSVSTRNNTGLAVSEDGGLTFERPFDGPVLERTPEEPCFAYTPEILIEDGVWHCWYGSGLKWVITGGKPEALFTIKYATSKDGVTFDRPNHTCIHPSHEMEVACRPAIVKQNGVYRMWYSVRGASDFRGGENSYRIGYAESTDRLTWERMDSESGIDVSEDGWDCEMVCFCSVVEADRKLHMFYNGNGFGLTGIGYAFLDEG